MMKKICSPGLVLAAAALMLAGCASSTPEQEDLLSRAITTQAQTLNQQLPVTENGISLVRANAAQGHTLVLEMYQSDNQMNAQTFLDSYSNTLCRDAETRQRLAQGISYQLVLTTADKQRLQRSVTQCGPA
ncbi:type II secretion system pilot lipoprotein GspS-beta [Ewingella americana]|uniref:type II secretion system pilot lipoprotein GspS-beta n=1 Tax=Ewingella americana TaxID=41202 RepID=UPI0012AD5AAB|nr:type II secretion system pilot lipoprotein GspS-beta [Ewingella americana]MRT05939.1 hypothetical protein [Ewingella americana]